jgi:molybdopterin-guanine dinucleotide biosynthesis protein B
VASPGAGNIIGVVGWKDTGKTTVVAHLVGLLSGKGYKVGTVKHAHDRVDLEPEGTDSMKHLGAGAALTVTAGEDITVVTDCDGGDLERLLVRYLWSCDYIVVEGFKETAMPKIAVVAEGEAVPAEAQNVVAVICRGEPREGYQAFTFDQIDELLAYLLESGIIGPPSGQTVLVINGKPVPINDFVQTSLAGVIRGFITSLKDIEPPATISLHIRK